MNNVLITGGTGSIGSGIAKAVLPMCQSVRILSRDEARQQQMRRELDSPKLRFLIGDVRDYERMKMALRGIDTVFHAAAMKHVPVCEYNAFEAVQTNVIGTQNVIRAAIDAGVDTGVLISTDKAVLPVSTMGATKLLAERSWIAANAWAKKPTFCAVRLVNVIGSRGSIFDVMDDCMARGVPIPVTDLDATRFFMCMDSVVDAVLHAAKHPVPGKIFRGEHVAIRLGDLVSIYAPGHPVRLVGLGFGEKKHEIIEEGWPDSSAKVLTPMEITRLLIGAKKI